MSSEYIPHTTSSSSNETVLEMLNCGPDIKVIVDPHEERYSGHGCISWPVALRTSRKVREDEEVWLIQEIWAKTYTWAESAQTQLEVNKFESLENELIVKREEPEDHYWEAWKIKPGSDRPDYGTITRFVDDEYQPAEKPLRSRGTFKVEGWILAHKGPLPSHFKKNNIDTQAHQLYATTMMPHGWEQTAAYGTRHSMHLRWNTIDKDKVTTVLLYFGDRYAVDKFKENNDGTASTNGERVIKQGQNNRVSP